MCVYFSTPVKYLTGYSNYSNTTVIVSLPCHCCCCCVCWEYFVVVELGSFGVCSENEQAKQATPKVSVCNECEIYETGSASVSIFLTNNRVLRVQRQNERSQRQTVKSQAKQADGGEGEGDGDGDGSSTTQ